MTEIGKRMAPDENRTSKMAAILYLLLNNIGPKNSDFQV